MPIYRSKKFPESRLAHSLLYGMKGLEIGGSYHNAFGLDTLNVDYTADMDTVFKKYEVELCGEAMPVDIVANGNCLPVPDKSFDFVISSHVIEHFYDPISAIKEWARVARKYIYIICPLPNADPGDRGKLLTSLEEIIKRHNTPQTEIDDHRHYSRWTVDTFIRMVNFYGYFVAFSQAIDDKVGNGFTVVIDLQPNLNI